MWLDWTSVAILWKIELLIIFISFKLFQFMYMFIMFDRFRVACLTNYLSICHSSLSNETFLSFLRAYSVRFPRKPTAVQHHPHSNLPTHAVVFLPTQPSMCGWCYYSTGWIFHQVHLVMNACHKCLVVCIFSDLGCSASHKIIIYHMCVSTFRTAESLCEQSVSQSRSAVSGDKSRGHSGPVCAQTTGHPKSYRWV